MSGIVLSLGQPSPLAGAAGLAGVAGGSGATGWLAADGTTGTVASGVANVLADVGSCVGDDVVSPVGRALLDELKPRITVHVLPPGSMVIVWPVASPLAVTFTGTDFPGASEPSDGDTVTVPAPPLTVRVQFSVALALLVSVMVVGAVMNFPAWLVVGAVSVVGAGVGADEEECVGTGCVGAEEVGAEFPEPWVAAVPAAGWPDEPGLDCAPEPGVPPELLPLPLPEPGWLDPLLPPEPLW
jgi:hypothetical protein